MIEHIFDDLGYFKTREGHSALLTYKSVFVVDREDPDGPFIWYRKSDGILYNKQRHL